MLYSKLNQKEQAEKYFGELDKLQDSLQVFSFYQYWWLLNKHDVGLFTLKQAIQTVDNHFNGHLYLPESKSTETKAELYLFAKERELDSAWKYISIASKFGADMRNYQLYYYSLKKDYNRMEPLLKEELGENKKRKDIARLLGNYSWLVDVYKNHRDYKRAFEYLDSASQLRDSLYKLKNEEGVAGMEIQKQEQLQESAMNEQKRQQREEKARIEFKNKIRSYTLLAGVAILILIAGVLWRNNRRKQKDKLKIERAYNELKATQAQLIQSEKMASLGELTAGIAHEIQNPLNFVNNFSEVNDELINELQSERSKVKSERNERLEDDIINDIKQNLEKINHHGKRADAIVKGMLQHSRTSSGQKELTDINALADEYLRLAYHGLRAKDKSFNAEFKTDFDPSIGKINIVPQDIGRVLLNLINNAFYAVSEKQKLCLNGYEPSVTIITTKQNGKVEIIVKDNGNGIPQNVVEKIFQPFFTTKPTGQGTGLGLSLAYDIIKAHGGEMKVETREGEGSEFIIQMPV